MFDSSGPEERVPKRMQKLSEHKEPSVTNVSVNDETNTERSDANLKQKRFDRYEERFRGQNVLRNLRASLFYSEKNSFYLNFAKGGESFRKHFLHKNKKRRRIV